MFKPGDKIVCIKNNYGEHILTVNDTYTVRTCEDGFYVGFYYVTIVNMIGMTFKSNRFISLKEYRKNKLKKICLNQEIE